MKKTEMTAYTQLPQEKNLADIRVACSLMHYLPGKIIEITPVWFTNLVRLMKSNVNLRLTVYVNKINPKPIPEMSISIYAK